VRQRGVVLNEGEGTRLYESSKIVNPKLVSAMTKTLRGTQKRKKKPRNGKTASVLALSKGYLSEKLLLSRLRGGYKRGGGLAGWEKEGSHAAQDKSHSGRRPLFGRGTKGNHQKRRKRQYSKGSGSSINRERRVESLSHE